MDVKRPKKIFTRSQIIDLIADGKVIVIYKNNVLNLTSWIKKHPGGDKAAYHMVGKDATDEMHAYHCDETVDTFTRFKIGEIEGPRWENLLPPIQGGIYAKGGHYGSLNNKNTSNKKTLDSKLDNDSSNSTSDLECLTTTNSCDSAISETEIANYKGIGFVPLVKPVVPQNQLVTKSNMDIVFPIIDEETKKKVIRNPNFTKQLR